MTDIPEIPWPDERAYIVIKTIIASIGFKYIYFSMIVWIASYPKSGNTYVRSFLSAYYFSENGEFNFDLLKHIKQFPNVEFFENPLDSVDSASENWIAAQKKIKENKKALFLKTHNCLGNFKGRPFTTAEYTLGGIYVVRDPRNVLTSVKNHFTFDDNQALKFITNFNTEIKHADSGDFRTWTLLSSWSNHYKSWIKSKNFRKLLIKYEDLENDKYSTFRDIIIFVNALLNRTERIDKKKLEKAIETTDFNVLKNREKKEGFEEAAYSKDKQVKTFFNMGFNNKWKNLLNDEIRQKVDKEFNSEMKELGYL